MMGLGRGFDGAVEVDERYALAGEDVAMEAPPSIGGDERRMHVRAYNFWVALLRGKPFPVIADLHPEQLGDFGPNSVLLDFRTDPEAPLIQWLGDALRVEGGMAEDVRTIADVPDRSLLSRLMDHYQQIMANRAPIGFEAEFMNARGNCALYRGILMPFSSNGATIDFVYGVINWKELADATTAAEIMAAARAAMAAAPRTPPAAASVPIWADGPSRGGIERSALLMDTAIDTVPSPATGSPLTHHLPMAREAGNAVRAAELRCRAALYHALGVAYDLAFSADRDPSGYAGLLSRAGLRRQPRAPWLPIVKLVFGKDYDRARLSHYACVLAHAWRHDVAPGGMRGFLENSANGLRGIAMAERLARRADQEFDAG